MELFASPVSELTSRPSFQLQIVLCSLPHVYAPGNYVYPFEYQLPADLPGVIDIANYSGDSARHLKASIRYKFKACLDVDGFLSRDLKGEIAPVVHARVAQPITASEDHTEQDVRFLCCFSKGRCQLAVCMDKNVYFPGEVAQIQCNIANNSDVDITRMTCRLYQELIVRAAGGRVRTVSKVLSERSFAGVKQHSSLQQPQPLPLVADTGRGVMTASTGGRILECRYRVEIECDITWRPDVRLRLPVQMLALYVPPVQVWLPANTADFVPQPIVKYA